MLQAVHQRVTNFIRLLFRAEQVVHSEFFLEKQLLNDELKPATELQEVEERRTLGL